ncbi:MAG: sensor histidine kinase [Chloroflexi bacterium]|nr:sensor histidine kinase [Chloroflexota bacterium]
MMLSFIVTEMIEELTGAHMHFGPSGPHEGFYLEAFIFGILGPIIVGLGFHWIVKIVEQLEAARASEQKLRLELERQTAVRRELLTETLRTQEAERQRVARELHDGLGQPLSAFVMVVEADENILSNNPIMNHAHCAAVNALDSTRRLILDLRPSLLDAQGLLPALRQCANNALSPLGIRVDVTAVGQPQPIPDHVKTTLFRIGQETCANILRHSQAQNANIHLQYAPNEVHLTVTDNGIGFDQAAPCNNHKHSLGLGLLSMQERAEQVNGRFHLQTQPGQGTKITVSIPLITPNGEPS